MKKRPEKILYFASTHWDREWYRTIDEFRFKLVEVLDKIIDVLTHQPEFSIFTIDGQTSLIEDYLMIRGENRQILTQLIQQRRIVIGPWYTMPDEFLVTSESLVQNLLAGHRIAESYGVTPLKSGYVCDIFGHVANFPQLLSGFHIKNALISRGTNDYNLECFFSWHSPDNSAVTTFKAPETCGYGSFYFEVLFPFAPDYTSHLDEITENAIAYVERELTRTSLPYVILMDGMDHETIHEFMPEILNRLSQHFACPVVQERLDDFFQELSGSLPTKTGELAEHCRDNVMHNKVIPHTVSSRYDLKLANDRCQNTLERFSMPAAALQVLEHQKPIIAYLDYAYSLLLQNHAHDSICGCSIAAVHREMLSRFEKTQATATEFFHQYCTQQYQKQYTNEEGTISIEVFNPLPYEYKGLIELDIDFPAEFPVTSLPYIKWEQRNSFLLIDEQNQELPYNILHAARSSFIKPSFYGKQLADTHRVAFLSSLRPMGFTSFTVRPSDRPYRITNRFSTGPASCENELIRFEIAADGTVTLTDKQTGQCYPGLHSFLDCAEAGDGWFHIRPIADRQFSSRGCQVRIAKIFDGYAACKFLVTLLWELPERLCNEMGFSVRSSKYTACQIDSEFTIARTSKLVSVKTTIHNTIRDHRIQLHLPINVPADYYQINQCNLVLQRPIAADTTHFDWKENDITEASFENMAWIQTAARGLLFISGGGLHEVSPSAADGGSLDITLLRCFQRTTGTNGEDDGQLLGSQTFSYALMPLSCETNAELVRIKDQFISGYHTFTIPNSRPVQHQSGFTLQSRHCIYITSLPSRTNGILIRIANYSGQEDISVIRFSKTPVAATLCNYLEEPTDSAEINNCNVSFCVPGFSMITLHVTV